MPSGFLPVTSLTEARGYVVVARVSRGDTSAQVIHKYASQLIGQDDVQGPWTIWPVSPASGGVWFQRLFLAQSDSYPEGAVGRKCTCSDLRNILENLPPLAART